jgi:hypothetical protein
MIWISLLSNWSRWMGGSRACKDGGIEVTNTSMRGSQGFEGERSWETWSRDSEDRWIISTNDRKAPNTATTVYHRPSTSHICRRQSLSRSIKVTHYIIRHHPNRHNPSLQCLGTLSKSLSFQSHLLSNLLLTFQRSWLRIRIDDCTILALNHPQHHAT